MTIDTTTSTRAGGVRFGAVEFAEKLVGIARLMVAAGLVVASGLSFVASASAQDAGPVTLHWGLPSSGSTPVSYNVQIQDIDGTYDEITPVQAVPGSIQTYEFPGVEYMHRYRARVMAVDGQGRQGPWSDWSAFYDRELPPPQP